MGRPFLKHEQAEVTNGMDIVDPVFADRLYRTDLVDMGFAHSLDKKQNMITLSRIQNTLNKKAGTAFVNTPGCKWLATVDLNGVVTCYGLSEAEARYNLAYRIFNSPALVRAFEAKFPFNNNNPQITTETHRNRQGQAVEK